MIQRCENPNNPNYSNYGGRGICVCDEWAQSFAIFYNDMDPRPGPQFSIDRIDNNYGYTPSNCKWSTRKEQARNKARQFLLQFSNED
jgi:hypothetical protein